ncbi:MAG: tRNA (guanosine(46)-N7)-methyltransferase TrmB [Crocinitomicaceae bacterium]
MGKNKLKRFADMKTMECVFEPDHSMIDNNNFPLKGNWHKGYFKNENPLVVELGCGKGEYTVGLGKRYPNKNYIGIDIKGARIWEGANTVREEGLKNIGWVRTRIEFVDSFFAKDEVDEIWLTFSDPQPNKPRKRLSSKLFLDRYRKFLKPGGIVHLKTDNDLLYASTLQEVEEVGGTIDAYTWDLYGELSENLDPETQDILSIKTHYEKLFSEKGYKIKYCKFRLPK